MDTHLKRRSLILAPFGMAGAALTGSASAAPRIIWLRAGQGHSHDTAKHGKWVAGASLWWRSGYRVKDGAPMLQATRALLRLTWTGEGDPECFSYITGNSGKLQGVRYNIVIRTDNDNFRWEQGARTLSCPDTGLSSLPIDYPRGDTPLLWYTKEGKSPIIEVGFTFKLALANDDRVDRESRMRFADRNMDMPWKPVWRG